MAKILIIEDDKLLAEDVMTLLEKDKHQVEIAATGSDGLHLVKYFGFELIIIDWHLPDILGPDLIGQLRAEGVSCPAIFLTGEHEVRSKAFALDRGADDYLTKPFEPIELSARVRALLRRTPIQLPDILDFGAIKIDTKRFKVTKLGDDVDLHPREYGLLEFFARHPGQIFSADALLSHLWKSDQEITNTAIRVCVSRLRKKLLLPGKSSIISNLYGIGYRFDAVAVTEKEAT